MQEDPMNKIMFCASAVLLVLASCATDGGPAMNTDYPEPDKICALTFDDGPDSVKTAKVLNKLEAYGVPATFFLVGSRINNSTKGVMERAKALGCEFGNHSWSYDSMDKMSAEEIKESISKTTNAIETYLGMTPAFFRPPNLATSQTMFDTIEYTFASGVLGYDWDGSTSAKKRAENVLSGMQDGAIILLHDVQPDPHPTPEALDILIPELKMQGYEFVTLSELFKRKGVDPVTNQDKMWVYVR